MTSVTPHLPIPITRRYHVHRLAATAAAIAAVSILAGPLAQPAGASQWRRHTVRVDGAVATPGTYTLSALAGLPQTSATVSSPGRHRPRAHTDEGVDLEALVTLASPTLPDAKNASLRVVVTVAGDDGSRTFALGELDANFGNHPALLALTQDGNALSDGPDLVVPGDAGPARSVHGVRRVTVSVESPGPTTTAGPGGITVISRRGSAELTASELALLPTRTLSVTFVAGTAPQNHTETGPTLSAVLAAAHIRSGPDTWVAAVGSDGYVATVTPAEATVGGRPLLISTVEDGVALAQPRLVTDGDVKGGRYVSLLVDLVVGRGSLPSPATAS